MVIGLSSIPLLLTDICTSFHTPLAIIILSPGTASEMALYSSVLLFTFTEELTDEIDDVAELVDDAVEAT